MNSIIRSILVFTTTIGIITGCSTTADLSKVEDWNTFGYKWAMSGNIIHSRQEVGPNNFKSYASGYQRGLDEFCSQDGYMVAVKDLPYNGICHKDYPDFAEQYDNGYTDERINEMNMENDNSSWGFTHF